MKIVKLVVEFFFFCLAILGFITFMAWICNLVVGQTLVFPW
jgi:hypothetical protein